MDTYLRYKTGKDIWEALEAQYYWRLNNASSYNPQAHKSVVAFPLEYPPRLINPWNKWIAMLN
jgi:hypothetical protein